jgi:hypothetical protein
MPPATQRNTCRTISAETGGKSIDTTRIPEKNQGWRLPVRIYAQGQKKPPPIRRKTAAVRYLGRSIKPKLMDRNRNKNKKGVTELQESKKKTTLPWTIPEYTGIIGEDYGEKGNGEKYRPGPAGFDYVDSFVCLLFN